MEAREFLFFRGSSPTLELVLPLAVAPEDAAVLSFSQGGEPVLVYAMNDQAQSRATGRLHRDEAEENVLLLEMSQRDTLALASGHVELQLRVANALGADTFHPLQGLVGPTLYEGMIG